MTIFLSSAAMLMTEIRKSFNVELSLAAIHQAPTVAGMAQLIMQKRKEREERKAIETEKLLQEIEAIPPDAIDAMLDEWRIANRHECKQEVEARETREKRRKTRTGVEDRTVTRTKRIKNVYFAFIRVIRGSWLPVNKEFIADRSVHIFPFASFASFP